MSKERKGSATSVTAMKSRLAELRGQMKALGVVMRGSVVVIGVRNKQAYFSLNKNGKTQLIYLGKKREAQAREYSQNYRRLREIVEEMTTINMTLLKVDADAACP
jgi:hypothetical protein